MTRGRPGATAPVPSDYWAPEPVCNCRLPAVSWTAWLRSPCEVKLHITARVQTLDTRRETGLCAFYHFSLFAIKAKMCWFIATASGRWLRNIIIILNSSIHFIWEIHGNYSVVSHLTTLTLSNEWILRKLQEKVEGLKTLSRLWPGVVRGVTAITQRY